MPKASLRLKVFFQIGQIFHLLPQLWKHVLELHILLAVAAELSVVAAACHQRVTCRQALRHSITSHGGQQGRRWKWQEKQLCFYKSFRTFCRERDTAGIGKNHVHDNYQSKGSLWPHRSAKVAQKRRNVNNFLAQKYHRMMDPEKGAALSQLIFFFCLFWTLHPTPEFSFLISFTKPSCDTN